MTDPNITTNRIAELNDMLRKTFFAGGRVVMTQGIRALPEADQSAIREKVEIFDDFSEDNDPYGERDFGSFEHAGHKSSGRSITTIRASPSAAKTRPTPPRPAAFSPSCSPRNTSRAEPGRPGPSGAAFSLIVRRSPQSLSGRPGRAAARPVHSAS
jgi:hypothetical protein